MATYNRSLTTKADEIAKAYLKLGFTPHLDAWLGHRVNRITALYAALYCHSRHDAARFMLALHHSRARGRLPGLEPAQEARAASQQATGA